MSVASEKKKLSLIDIEEAVPAFAPSHPEALMPEHFGERVVAGARALSPNLGDRMAAGDLLGRPVIVRELKPQDLKLEIEQFTRKEAVGAARYLSSVLGKAHGRQMPHDARREWVKELKGRLPVDLEAPAWLWDSVVALLVHHEEAYLKHCRLHALNN